MRGGWGASLDGAGRADLGEKSGRDSLASHFLTQLGLAEADPEREAGTQPSLCLHRPPPCLREWRRASLQTSDGPCSLELPLFCPGCPGTPALGQAPSGADHVTWGWVQTPERGAGFSNLLMA